MSAESFEFATCDVAPFDDAVGDDVSATGVGSALADVVLADFVLDDARDLLEPPWRPAIAPTRSPLRIADEPEMPSSAASFLSSGSFMAVRVVVSVTDRCPSEG